MRCNLAYWSLVSVVWFQLEFPHLFRLGLTVAWLLDPASLSSMGSTFWAA